MYKFYFLSLLMLINISAIGQNVFIDSEFNAKDAGSKQIPGFSARNNTVKILQDGKLLVGGYPGTYNDVSLQGLIKLNIDGSVDSTFNPDFLGEVFEMAVQPDSKILIWGEIYSGTTDLLRLNPDGSLDTTFKPALEPYAVLSNIVFYSGKIYLAGKFSTYNNISKPNLVRLNLDGTIDNTFITGAGPSDRIFDIEILSNGQLIIAGEFNLYNNVQAKKIARINPNGSLDPTFNAATLPGSSYNLQSIVVQSDSRIVAGYSDDIVRFNVNGTIDQTFNPSLPYYGVTELFQTSSGKILVGGYKDSLPVLFRLYPDGITDATFNTGSGPGGYYNYRVTKAFDVTFDGTIIMVGDFYSYNNYFAPNFAKISDYGAYDLSFNFSGGADYKVRATASHGNKLYVGGYFKRFNSVIQSSIFSLNADGTTDASFNTFQNPLQGSVTDIEVASDGKIIVSGTVNQINSTSPANIIRLESNGLIDQSFSSSVPTEVYAIELQADGKLLVAADSSLYRLNPNGSPDNTYPVIKGNSGTKIFTLKILPNGKVLIGGSFTSINGLARKYLIRLNSDGSIDQSFNTGTGPNGLVRAIELANSDQIYIGGDFTKVNGKSAVKIARLNSDGSVDQTLNTGIGFSSSVHAIQVVQDERILVGGSFTKVNGVDWPYLALLNKNGTIDSSFMPKPNNQVLSIEKQFNDKYIIGGDFTCFESICKTRLARVDFCDAPGVPYGVETKAVGITTATLHWNSVPDAVKYRVLLKKQSATKWEEFYWTKNTFLKLNNLDPSETYVWKVRAFNVFCPSEFSQSSMFATIADSCVAPYSLAISNLTAESAKVSWIDGGQGNTVSYNIRLRKVGESSYQYFNVQQPSSEFIMTNLQPGVKYEIRIKGVCNMDGSATSPWSGYKYFTTPVLKLASVYDQSEGIHFELFPNPADDLIYINSDESISLMEISNSLGQVIESVEVQDSSTSRFDVSDLPAGLYYIKVIGNGNRSEFKKLIVR